MSKPAGELKCMDNDIWLENGRAITFTRATEVLEDIAIRRFVQQSESVIVGNAVYAEDYSTIKVHLTADWQRTLCGIETDNISTPTKLAVTCKSCTERFRRYS